MPIMVRCGGGSGASMNYTVKAYAALADLPAAGKTNEIAVITSTAIGAHTFAVTQPTARADGTALQAGDVWLATGSQSNFPFNALRKNGLYVYGQFAFQYDGTAWQSVTVKIWYGGTWVDWALLLYHAGNECAGVTGGWLSYQNQTGSVTKNASNLVLYTQRTDGNSVARIATNNAIDFSTISTLKMLYTQVGGSNATRSFGVGASQYNTSLASAVPDDGTLVVASVDVSAIDGYAYVSCLQAGTYSSSSTASCTLTVFRIWGE